MSVSDLSGWVEPPATGDVRLDRLERQIRLMTRLIEGYDDRLRAATAAIEKVAKILKGDDDEPWAAPWRERWDDGDGGGDQD